MAKLNRITVFCSTSPGTEPEFVKLAQTFGNTLASRDLTLVYGGSGNGMAGSLVTAALEAGGQVIGVMPRFLVERGKVFDQLRDLRVAEDMHAHKALMAELGDGFIALPGGLGTLEEFFEALTWAQLGLHSKPCGLINVNGFFDSLLDFMDNVRDRQFITPQTRELLLVAEEPAELLDRFMEFVS